MSNVFPSELAQFHQFLGRRLTAGDNGLSPEEVLDEWRLAYPASEILEADVAAVRQALDEMAGGEPGKPLADFSRDFQARHGLPLQP